MSRRKNPKTSASRSTASNDLIESRRDDPEWVGLKSSVEKLAGTTSQLLATIESKISEKQDSHPLDRIERWLRLLSPAAVLSAGAWVLYGYFVFGKAEQDLILESKRTEIALQTRQTELAALENEQRRLAQFDLRASLTSHVVRRNDDGTVEARIEFSARLENYSDNRMSVHENAVRFFVGRFRRTGNSSFSMRPVVDPGTYVRTPSMREISAVEWISGLSFANSEAYSPGHAMHVEVWQDAIDVSGMNFTGPVMPRHTLEHGHTMVFSGSRDDWIGVRLYVGLNDATESDDFLQRIDWIPVDSPPGGNTPASPPLTAEPHVVH